MPQTGDNVLYNSPSNSGYSEMYMHENATAFTIEEVNAAHAVHGFTQGILSTGWTFKNGQSITTTAFATSDGGTKTKISHGATNPDLANGDIVTIANTTSYDGIYIIEQVVADTSFVIAQAFVGDEGAKVLHAASYLTNANSTATGYYAIRYSTSSTNGSANEIFEFEVYSGTSEQVQTETQRKYATAGDYGVIAMAGILNYTAGYKVWLKTQNNSGTGTITIRNANFSLIRLI